MTQQELKHFKEAHPELKIKLSTHTGKKKNEEIIDQYYLMNNPDFTLTMDKLQPLSESEPDSDDIPPLENDPDEPPNEEQKGEGLTKSEGLTDVQINNMMKKYKRFVGAFAADEMDKIPVKKQFGFIINTSDRSKGDGHWVACYIDVVKDMSVDYYDSFANSPSKKFLKGLKQIVDKLNPSVYLKLKINKIKEQKISSPDCGWHCIAFLVNRFHDVPFKERTGYSDYVKGSKEVKDLKQKFSKFDYI